VRRPAVYELNNERTVAELVAMAGGLLPTAYKSEVALERLSKIGDRIVIDIDLNRKSDQGFALASGDVLWVGSALEEMEFFVRLSGHVQRPGTYQWREGIRVADVIGSIDDGLRPRPDLNYAVIKRQLPPDFQVEVQAVNLRNAFAEPKTAYNTPLQPRDEIVVFSITEDRAKTLAPVIAQLRDQAVFGRPERVVSIDGFVDFPGDYPLSSGMRFSDLAQAAVLQQNVDLEYALIVRDHMSEQPIEVISVIPGQAVAAPGSATDIVLQPKDRVLVFDKDADRRDHVDPIIAALRRQARVDEPEQVVAVAGQVRFPVNTP
jgi:polysaccharide export outer membrane protein